MFRRALRSRGFGIHSPLAFSLVTKALCWRDRRVAYYDDPGRSPRARRLNRVIQQLRPDAIIPHGDIPSDLVHLCHPDPDAVQPLIIVAEPLPPGSYFALWGPRELVLPHARGLSFSGRDGETLVVNRPDLPRLHFDISMR